MRGIIKVTGVEQVVRNLLRSKGKIGNGVERGLKKAGLFLLAESKKIVPVQTGVLKASTFIVSFGSGLHTDVILGYKANYAALVHELTPEPPPSGPPRHGKEFNIYHAAEIVAAKGTWRGTAEGGMFKRGENQQAKFLEKPARENRLQLLKIIRDTVMGIK